MKRTTCSDQRSASLEKLVRRAEADPRLLSADDDWRLARSVETEAGRELSWRTTLGRVDGHVVDFDLEDELVRSGVKDRARGEVRARLLFEQREVAAASRNRGQDEGQSASQLSASCPLVEQARNGESRDAEIEMGWRSKCSDNFDRGILGAGADANRLTAELFLSSQKALNQAPGIDERAYNLAALVDPEGFGSHRSSRVIDCGEASIVQQIAVGYITVIGECANDLAPLIDPVACGKCGAGEIDLSEGAIVPEKAMSLALIIYEAAHDPATIIDTKGYGTPGSREINGSEGAIV